MIVANQINFGISTTTGTPDSNALFSNFGSPYFTIATSGIESKNCRQMFYNTTNPTTLYFLGVFLGGVNNYAYATTYMFSIYKNSIQNKK